MCSPARSPPPSHRHFHHWISKIDYAQERLRAFPLTPPHTFLPPKLILVPKWGRNETIRIFFFSLENLQDKAQEIACTRCCGEHDHLVPLATYAEVRKSGNLTQESPSSVRADKAPNGLGQLVTQPMPSTRAWSEGVIGQGSVGGRLEA